MAMSRSSNDTIDLDVGYRRLPRRPSGTPAIFIHG